MSQSVLVAQIGARRHYAVPAGLASQGQLERLETTLCAAHPLVRFSYCIPHQLCPRAVRRLQQRVVADVPSAKIRSRGLGDLIGILRGKPDSEAERYRNWEKQNRKFCKSIVRKGFGGADSVYAFNTAAVEIFDAASKNGIKCILDQTMAPFAWVEERLLAERSRWSSWDASEVPRDAWLPLAERERREWQSASLIVCGSRFVVDAIRDCDGPTEKCVIVPYDMPSKGQGERSPQEGPLRVLFAGTLCLRKGIQYLCEALQEIPPGILEVRAVGPVEISDQALMELRSVMTVVGPCSRQEMAGHYDWADVLTLPTLAEGSANVTYEAMRAGVPVITTQAAGSIIENNQGGWIVPTHDSRSLRDLLLALGADREAVQNARRSITDLIARLPTASYGSRLAEAMLACSSESRGSVI